MDRAVCVDDGSDAGALDRSAQRVASDAAISAVEEGVAESIGEHAGRALQKEQPPPAHERLERCHAAGGVVGDGQHGDQPVGEVVGGGGEVVVQDGDEVDHLAERRAGVDAIGDERHQCRAAGDECLAVGLHQAGGASSAQQRHREAGDARVELAAREPQRRLIERGVADVETQERGQARAGIPGGEQVLDAGERVAALLEPGDELEASAVGRAVQPDPAVPAGRREQTQRLVLADGAHGEADGAGELVDGDLIRPGSRRGASHGSTLADITVTVNSVMDADATDVLSRLLADLRVLAAEPRLDFASPPWPLAGGFWADLYAFSLSSAPPGWSGDLVARIMPNAEVAAKETVVQRAVADAGFPTPVVRGAAGPESAVGRSFMVMDRADGLPLLADLHGGRALARLPSLARRIPAVLAVTMARLHAVDARPVTAQLAGVSGVATDVRSMLESLGAGAKVHDRADLADAVGRLAEHQPAPTPSVVCHGDLHPFNLLADGHGRVTVLDWSAAVIGPAAYDVAFTSLLLAEPPLTVPASMRRLVRTIGSRLARRFVLGYQNASGSTVDPDALRWHQALVCTRALVEVAGWVDDATVDARRGHPWLVCGDAFAARLAAVSGVPVRAR